MTIRLKTLKISNGQMESWIWPEHRLNYNF